MSTQTASQREHIATIIKTKRKALYGYMGGNRDLANLIGVSPQRLSMLACNKRTPSRQELLKLAEVFDMSMDALCGVDKRGKKAVRGRGNKRSANVDTKEVRTSMLKICDITTDLVDRQRQMLHGGLMNVKEYAKTLSRIRKYVAVM